MAATEPLYLRLTPGLKDRIVAAARRDGVSANEWAQETLRRALASGAGGAVSAGLAVSSAPVASDGALAESGNSGSGGGSDGRVSSASDRPGSASAPASDEPAPSMFFPPSFSLKPGETAKALAKQTPGVSTAGDLAKKQVTPFGKHEQAGRKK